MLILLIANDFSAGLKKPIFWQIGLTLRTLFLFVMPFILVRIFVKQVVKSKVISSIQSGLLTFVYMSFLIFILLEIGATFIVKTIPVEYSLSSQNWHLLYGGPRNSYHFRDYEFTKDKDKDKVIGFFGDSFTEGYGIKNYKDRFSNLVEADSDYETWNYGIQGSDVKSVIEIISNLKYVPDITYVQFYFNDIISSGVANKQYYKGDKGLSSKKKYYLKTSYLINNVYCIRRMRSKKDESYIEYLKEIIANDKVWEDHSNDIQTIYNLCKNSNTELRAIIFPYMKDSEVSKFYTESVKGVLDSLRVPVINVDEMIENVPLTNRVVNNLDPHPSVHVNKLVARRIIRDLKLAKD